MLPESSRMNIRLLRTVEAPLAVASGLSARSALPAVAEGSNSRQASRAASAAAPRLVKRIIIALLNVGVVKVARWFR